MNTFVTRVVDCCDSDCHYGILVIKSNGFLTEDIVQKKIGEIKDTFVDPDSEDIKDDDILWDEYTIRDIIDRFPKEWDVVFHEDNAVVV